VGWVEANESKKRSKKGACREKIQKKNELDSPLKKNSSSPI
jgi:hypothetical protein